MGKFEKKITKRLQKLNQKNNTDQCKRTSETQNYIQLHPNLCHKCTSVAWEIMNF